MAYMPVPPYEGSGGKREESFAEEPLDEESLAYHSFIQYYLRFHLKQFDRLTREYERIEYPSSTTLSIESQLQKGLNWKEVRDTFGEIASEHKPLLSYIAYRVLENYHAAEDVVQASLLKAYNYLTGISSPDKRIEPKSWLSTIVLHTALNYLRDERKLIQLAEQSSWFLTLETRNFERPDLRVVYDEIILELGSALYHLSDVQLQVIMLHYVEDKPLVEIAQQLGRPISTIKSDHRRALSKLRELISSQRGDLYIIAKNSESKHSAF